MSESVAALRARITLQTPARADDDIGGAALTYANAGSVWAAIESTGGGADDAFGALRSRVSYRLSIRRRTDVRAGWRVLWGARALRVDAVRDDGGVRIVLNCVEESL